jgi:hypothetical protein
MGRTGRIGECVRRVGLRFGVAGAALAVGFFLFFTPAAMASGTGVSDGPAGVAVLAQAAPPSGEQPAPPPASNPPEPALNQRAVVGTAGIVLIALVLLSRKARKKPVFGTWRPKK